MYKALYIYIYIYIYYLRSTSIFWQQFACKKQIADIFGYVLPNWDFRKLIVRKSDSLHVSSKIIAHPKALPWPSLRQEIDCGQRQRKLSMLVGSWVADLICLAAVLCWSIGPCAFEVGQDHVKFCLCLQKTALQTANSKSLVDQVCV